MRPEFQLQIALLPKPPHCSAQPSSGRIVLREATLRVALGTFAATILKCGSCAKRNEVCAIAARLYHFRSCTMPVGLGATVATPQSSFINSSEGFSPSTHGRDLRSNSRQTGPQREWVEWLMGAFGANRQTDLGFRILTEEPSVTAR